MTSSEYPREPYPQYPRHPKSHSDGILDEVEPRGAREHSTRSRTAPQPDTAILTAIAHGFIVRFATDAGLRDVWTRSEGQQTQPLGRLLVVGTINEHGSERRVWLARSAMKDTTLRLLTGRALERLVTTELRDVTCGTVLMLERNGKLHKYPYIHQRYRPESRAALYAFASWFAVALFGVTLRGLRLNHRQSRRDRGLHTVPIPARNPSRRSTVA